MTAKYKSFSGPVSGVQSGPVHEAERIYRSAIKNGLIQAEPDGPVQRELSMESGSDIEDMLSGQLEGLSTFQEQEPDKNEQADDDEFESEPDIAEDAAIDHDSDDVLSLIDDDYVDVPKVKRIPDPDRGEITHAEFLAAGHSMKDLLKQQQEFLSASSDKEGVGEQNKDSGTEAGADYDPNHSAQREHQQPAQQQGAPSLAGFAAALASIPFLAAGYAASGAVQVVRSSSQAVADFSYKRSVANMRNSLGGASQELANLTTHALQGLNGEETEDERKEKMRDVLKKEEHAGSISKLLSFLALADMEAKRAMAKGLKATSDPDAVMQSTLSDLAAMQAKHKGVLDSIELDGRSLNDRLGDTMKNLFEFGKNIIANFVQRFGNNADTPSAPKMG